jgi:hypothetical protein
MDVRLLPEAQSLERWLHDHNMRLSMVFRGTMTEHMRNKGHSVEEWLDGSTRSLKLRPELRDLIRAFGEKVWEDDPNRIIKVTGYETGPNPPALVIDGL